LIVNRIQKHHYASLFHFNRQFRRELVTLDDLRHVRGELLFEKLSSAPADPVVFPESIAVSDY
jgi:hypothetical protein